MRTHQSEVAWRDARRAFTSPASWIAPPNSSSFSVSVVCTQAVQWPFDSLQILYGIPYNLPAGLTWDGGDEAAQVRQRTCNELIAHRCCHGHGPGQGMQACKRWGVDDGTSCACATHTLYRNATQAPQSTTHTGTPAHRPPSAWQLGCTHFAGIRV